MLLNNDVVVTDGWLDQLIALTNARADRLTGEHADGEWRPSVGRAGSETGLEGIGRDELSGFAGRHNVKIIDLDGEGGLEDPAEVVAGHAESTSLGLPRTWRVVAPGPPPWPPLREGGTDAGRVRSFGIGLVGPMSNYAAPPQLVEGVPYHDIGDMHRYARRWRDEHRGQWFTVPKLSGFCLLMKRAVYDKIGGLDERFGLGFFDDDDLAERARRAGFELAVAHDLFVHHFGSRTFAGNGIDAGKCWMRMQGGSLKSGGCVGPTGDASHFGRGRQLGNLTRTLTDI